jgi:hypothetical protein
VEGFSRCIANWHERLQAPEPVNHRQIARSQFDYRKRLGAVLDLYHELSGATRLSSPPKTVVRKKRKQPAESYSAK